MIKAASFDIDIGKLLCNRGPLSAESLARFFVGTGGDDMAYFFHGPSGGGAMAYFLDLAIEYRGPFKAPFFRGPPGGGAMEYFSKSAFLYMKASR